MKKLLLALGLVVSVATYGWAGYVYTPPFTPTPTVDLADTSVSSGYINGANFVYYQGQPTGTGVFDPFLTVQANGNEQGYNTGVHAPTPLPFDTKRFGSQAGDSGWTRTLKVGELLQYNGNYIFVLDLAEGGGPNSLLSLDGLKIFTSTDGMQNSESVDANGDANGILGTLRYDMDAGGDHFVLLDDNRGTPGQGTSDMLVYIPVSALAGADPNDYLIMWSRFGLQDGADANGAVDAYSNSNFEEWSALIGSNPPPVPEPGTMLLLGTGLFGLAIYGKRRMNHES